MANHIHIVNFSGGKDSTAMLLLMLENNYHIDEIIFCDTGLEFPEMYTHIDKVEAYIKRPITRLKSENSFEYYMFDHIKTKGKYKGNKGYGFPTHLKRWCTRVFKIDTCKKYLQEKYPDKQIVFYNGYAFDEIKRVKIYDEFHQQPLIDYGITEADALHRCYVAGFDWGGLYKKFSRVSCWCCPFQGIKDLRNLYYFYPDFWKQLEEWQSKNDMTFRADGSVFDFSKRFKEEFEKYESYYTLKLY